MKIPQYILDVFTDKYGFERLFNDFLSDSKSQKDAFDKTLAEIEKYIPDCEKLNTFQSFRQFRSKRLPRNRRELVEIPQDILDALKSVEHLEELYWTYYRRHKNSRMAFDQMMRYINKYIPNYKPYSSSESWRQVLRRRRKKEIKRNKKK